MIVKLSYLILFLLLLSVILNSIYIGNFTERIYSLSRAETVEDIDAFKGTFQKIKDIYNNNEIFVSLTVSHEDLTNIEEMLSEIEGAITAKDKDAVIIAKSRFESAVLHLGQLSALNIESIF